MTTPSRPKPLGTGPKPVATASGTTPARPAPPSPRATAPLRPGAPRAVAPTPASPAGPVQIPREELTFTYARSSGAGGQNVNKVNSKAILRWHPGSSRALTEAQRERFFARYDSRLTVDGDLIVMSDRHRDQGQNAKDCMDKLRDLIATIAVAPKKRKATKPTFGSKVRRLNSKRALKEKKANRRVKDD